MVVLDLGALTLKDGNCDGGLLVLVGCEGLGFLGWDDGSALNNRGHDTADSLNTKRKWGDINEKNVLGLLGGLASENTSLDGSTVGDGLIWVNATVGFLTVEEFLEESLDLWDTCRSTDKHDLVNLGFLKSSV